MPPKKSSPVESTEPAVEGQGPRRSTRVVVPKVVAPTEAPAKKTPAKKPASKAADKPEATKAAAKAPASKKRAAEDAPEAKAPASKKVKDAAAEPKAKAPASKKAKDDDAKPKAPASKKTKDDEAKPKSTKKPASTKAATDKPASKAANGTKAAADKPASKAAAKPASTKKPASKSADKPKSAAKPKTAKKAVDTIAEEGADVDMETDGKTEEQKKEIEAAAEASEPETSGAIKEGDLLPKLVLKDNKGEDVDVSTLVTDDFGLVLFTYPRADTPGCTSQACNYSAKLPDFEKYGYKVYGLSSDQPEAQEKWIQKKSLKFPLLCDPNFELLKVLGAFQEPKNTTRSHFIFEKGTGKLLQAQYKVVAAKDTDKCFEYIKKLSSSA